MFATELRTEYLTEPIGLGIRAPRLFWTCADGREQTAYRILARRGDETVWDSGKVASPRMTGIAWEGADLGSRDRVEWTVTLWDEDDREGDPASTLFELGLLDPADWTATWIAGDYRPRRAERRPVDCFRHEFTAEQVASARLYITACGLYEATLNGERVGDVVMAPGFTDYRIRLGYQAYDVTALVREGGNALEVQLADGWFRGSVGALGARNVYGTDTKLLAQLELTLADGTRRTIGSDGTWGWSDDGPLRAADMKDGEVVDLARTPSYGGRARETRYAVVPTSSDTVPVREKERFTPTVTRTPSGRQLFDFGQNIAGYVELEWEARAGQQVRLRFAEHLDDAGELDLAAIQVRSDKPTASPKQEIVLTSVEGTNRYRTRFAVFGFQLAEVESEIELDPARFTAIAVYSDMRATGTWSSSHSLVDRFVENTLWSMKGNFLEVPTDCPTRERAPWTGDAQIFTRTGSFLMDTSAFFRKWLLDLRDSQGADGKVPCIAPDVHNNHVAGYDLLSRMHGSAGWADAAVITPIRVYELFRDEQILRDAYDSMAAHVRFQIGRTNKTGLFGHRFPKPDRRYISNVGQAFGEWLEPADVYQQSVVGDLIAPHPEEATAYLAYACGIMARVARMLGHDDDIALFEEYRDGCTGAYVNQFTPVESDRQSKLVRPLALGLLDGDDELADATFARLVEAIERRDFHVGTGFLSTPLILPLLSARGRTDIAYRMLENEDAPGWLHEVLSGATTVWENWDGTASRNHYSPGSVCQWLFETVAGVDVVGEREFRLAPQPGGTLTHASFRYASVFGEVASSWARDGDEVRYRFEVPANTSAEIRLPGGTTELVGAGVWKYTDAA